MNNRLTEVDKNRIRRLLAENVPKAVIGQRLHLNRKTVDRVSKEPREGDGQKNPS